MVKGEEVKDFRVKGIGGKRDKRGRTRSIYIQEIYMI
jgi:hypothetical protein